MSTITIRELNANLSKAVARAEAGEPLEITRNGRVVAELTPPRPKRDARWRDAYVQMVSLMDAGMDLGGGRVTYADKHGPANG